MTMRTNEPHGLAAVHARYVAGPGNRDHINNDLRMGRAL